MRVLVTGAAGFIGSWLVDALLEQGHAVYGLDNCCGGDEANVSKRCGFIRGSILNRDAVARAVEGCDAIYHCAALAYVGLSVFSPALVTENILTGTLTVAEEAIKTGVKRLINLSSMARYGDNPVPYLEVMTPRPLDPYGVAKVAAEQTLNSLGMTHGMTVVHVVLHNVYGPRQRYWDPYRNVAAIMVNRLLQNKPPVIYGTGHQRRCFSYITDVLPTLLRLLGTEVKHGEVFNIGPDSSSITVNQLCTVLQQLTDIDLAPEYYPALPCEVHHATCSSEKIRRRFGYTPEVSLRAGLCELIAYIEHKGPRPFDYHLPLELATSQLPRAWKDRLL